MARPTLYLHDGHPLIDIRALDSAGLLLRHIHGCASLPAASWADRALELPPRCTPFSILHDGSAECLALMASLGLGNSGQALGQDQWRRPLAHTQGARALYLG